MVRSHTMPASASNAQYDGSGRNPGKDTLDGSAARRAPGFPGSPVNTNLTLGRDRAAATIASIGSSRRNVAITTTGNSLPAPGPAGRLSGGRGRRSGRTRGLPPAARTSPSRSAFVTIVASAFRSSQVVRKVTIEPRRSKGRTPSLCASTITMNPKIRLARHANVVSTRDGFATNTTRGRRCERTLRKSHMRSAQTSKPFRPGRRTISGTFQASHRPTVRRWAWAATHNMPLFTASNKNVSLGECSEPTSACDIDSCGLCRISCGNG